MNFFERRKLKKNAREVLRQARHVRNLRGDVLSPVELEKLGKAEGKLRDVMKASDYPGFDKATDDLYSVVNKLMPLRPWRGFSENFEIVIVAVAVAWGFRAYFIQPFKIPTGSMQPTLYGVHSEPNTKPGIFDAPVLWPLKWIVTGQRYKEIRAVNSGNLGPYRPPQGMEDQTVIMYSIDDDQTGSSVRYKLPRDVVLQQRHVHAGEVLWRGTVTDGDHVFVNKIAWNFRKPELGEIMVFTTEGIAGLPTGQHYIKRLTGRPGDELEIREPNLLIGGKEVTGVPGIERVAGRKLPGYTGYRDPVDQAGRTLWNVKTNIPAACYWAMGDNTRSSYDSRYWGTVPAINMVGPAFFVYWPLSERFGPAR